MPRRQVWSGGWWQAAGAHPSPNFGPRPTGERITLAVVHAISLPPGAYRGDAVSRLFLNTLDWDAHPAYQSIRGLQVSAHFFIRRNGPVLQFVSCEHRAWHAGASRWRGRDGCNDWSIGIELEGLAGDVFTADQYVSLLRLLGALRRRYPLADVVGHEHIAPGRKTDPGPGFDWTRLERGLSGERPRLRVASAADC